MANRRMLSKSISSSKKVTELYNLSVKDEDRSFPILLFTWLIPHADDFGKMDGTSFWIKYNVVPTLNITEKEIEMALKKLESSKLIKRYFNKTQQCLYINNFSEHQTGLNKRTKSKYPDPPDIEKKLNASESDIEEIIYNNLNNINGGKIIYKERQVRIDNKYIDILATTENKEQWIIEIKRQKISNNSESQLKGYLSLVANSKGILIGHGLNVNYKNECKNIDVFIYNDDMVFCHVTANNIEERYKMFIDVITQ